jgi:hypothetical protein
MVTVLYEVRQSAEVSSPSVPSVRANHPRCRSPATLPFPSCIFTVHFLVQANEACVMGKRGSSAAASSWGRHDTFKTYCRSEKHARESRGVWFGSQLRHVTQILDFSASRHIATKTTRP